MDILATIWLIACAVGVVYVAIKYIDRYHWIGIGLGFIVLAIIFVTVEALHTVIT